MRYRNRFAAGTLAAALALTACDSVGGGAGTPMRRPVSSPAGEDTTIVGLVGTMTGPDAWRGEDAFEGADLAVHELNRGDSGEEGREYELVTLDDEGDPQRAIDLVMQLALAERTAGIVYAGPPEALVSAEAALEEAGVPALLCYGDLYSARLLKPNLFQVSPPYLWQARRIAAYFYRDRRYTRVGLLVPRTLMGRTARASFVAAARQFRRRPIVDTYAPGAETLRPQLAALARARVNAVVVDGAPTDFATAQRELRVMGSTYRTTRIARRPTRRVWRPQVAGFDTAMSPRIVPDLLVPGTVASEDYARGAHYLPVPSFRDFRVAFEDWWGEEPLGWERRAYEAGRLIGWASDRAAAGETTVAEALTGLQRRRFGGLDVVFGPDDHTAVNQPYVGLWVVPRPGAAVRERDELPESLPWVPLARGFSIDGETTDVAARDWRHLFRSAPPARGPAPKNRKWRFGVTTPRSDPVH